MTSRPAAQLLAVIVLSLVAASGRRRAECLGEAGRTEDARRQARLFRVSGTSGR
jgi:hypothetical protein